MTSARNAGSEGAVRAAEKFLFLLATADGGAIGRLLVENGSVDQPLWGMARGRAEIQVMVSRAGGWLAARKAKVRHVTTTSNGERAVAEQVLNFSIDGKLVDVAVAVVAEAREGSASAIRTYHSTWLVTGAHALRPPLLAHDPSIVVPNILARHQRALAAGDVDGILGSYEEDGYAREPSSGAYAYSGKARLQQLYTMQLMSGGMELEYCSLTDDKLRCAIEYNFVRRGTAEIIPQAGIAVYERGTTGRVAGARVYDDVSPPAPRA